MADETPVQVSKDMKIGDLLALDPTVAPVFMNIGMFCVGCPASQGETIEEAAIVHGLDPDDLIEEINRYLATHEYGFDASGMNPMGM